MGAAGRTARRRRYVPLFYRVAGVNAVVLVAAVVVTFTILAPHRVSTFAADEAAVLVGALLLVAVLNLVLLRRVVGPLQALTTLARRVDLSRPERLPAAAPDSEAGELTLTFNEMLARLETERREATGRVLAAQEAERLRIAQELHDQVGQELTAVLLGLSRVHAQLEGRARADLAEMQEAVRSGLEDVRRIATELRPEALDDLGLLSALAVLCERFEKRSGLTVEQRLDEDLPALGPETELVVYRIAQEALTNAARHSGSDRARMTLRRDNGGVLLTITDSGVGLGGDPALGSGIRGMRERASLVGARLDVGPATGGGCEVRLAVAVPDAATAAR